MSDWYSMLMSDPSMVGMAFNNPGGFAQTAAAAGVPPPPLPPVQPSPMDAMASAATPMGPTMEQMNGVAPGGAGAPMETPSLGASLQPQQQRPNAGMLAGLAGMARPQTPQPQRISTPSPARPIGPGVKGGELLAMLSHLGLLGGTPPVDPYKLPSTLGSALGGR